MSNLNKSVLKVSLCVCWQPNHSESSEEYQAANVAN